MNQKDYEITLPIHSDLDGYKPMLFLEENDPAAYRKSLALMATYFRREFRFDRLQYESETHDTNFTGVLFMEQAFDLVEEEDHYPNRVIGGAGFWKTDSRYVIDWVWFHPFIRNRGTLKGYWRELKSRFGEFELSPPISEQMKRFLDKERESSASI